MAGKYWVDWAEYERLLTLLIGQIKDSNFKPDAVLGVARGGLLVADAVSREFNIPMAVVVASSYRGVGEVTADSLYVSDIASIAPLSGNVLVVDDLVDSGVTLQVLLEKLRFDQKEVSAFKTAVLWTKPASRFQPDFSASQLEHDIWIVQPFERREFN